MAILNNNQATLKPEAEAVGDAPGSSSRAEEPGASPTASASGLSVAYSLFEIAIKDDESYRKHVEPTYPAK